MRLLGLLGLLLVGLALAASCSIGGSGGDSAGPEVCEVVVFPVEQVMDEGDTFSSLLDVEPARGNQGAPAALLLLRGEADLGPYGPAIDFLAERYRAWDPSQGGGTEPELTDEVRSSAHRLDQDVAGGLCA